MASQVLTARTAFRVLLGILACKDSREFAASLETQDQRSLVHQGFQEFRVKMDYRVTEEKKAILVTRDSPVSRVSKDRKGTTDFQELTESPVFLVWMDSRASAVTLLPWKNSSWQRDLKENRVTLAQTAYLAFLEILVK